MAIKKRKFNPEKALETILYISERAPQPSTYWIQKIIYFADKLHLEKYGRQISGDDYLAFEKGPAPSQSYDIIKDVRNARFGGQFYNLAINAFQVNKQTNKVTALREPRLDIFSRSDLMCIDQSISENGMLTLEELKNKSHDAAYKAADENEWIPLSQIIEILPNAELVRDYIDCYESEESG